MSQKGRARDWLAQAANDMQFAENALASGFYAQCCFIAQQAAEKALKAVLYSRGAKAVMTHSLFKLCEELNINGDLVATAGTLDQYFLSGRYPDALPGGAPFQVFSRVQAASAVELAQEFMRFARGTVGTDD